jgi:outer membrane immunogenic protein
MKNLAIAITVTALIGTPAFAADMPLKAPPPAPAPVYSWTGWYIGGNIGGGWGDRNLVVSPNDPIASSFITQVSNNGGNFNSAPSSNNSGVIGGLQLGYNWQFNRNWLVGLETDFNWADVKGSTLTTTGGAFSQAEFFDEWLKWFGTVRGRLGYLATDNLLAFVTGGLAYGRVERTATDSNVGSIGIGQAQGATGFSFLCATAATCFTGTTTNTAVGWTIGGGLEYALWGNLTIKGEYLYVSLPGQSVTMAATAVLNPGNTPSTFNVGSGNANFNIARVGLNYRF